jgi:hypothetical protein
MNISTRGSMELRCCFGRLFVLLYTWVACQRPAQRPRITTPRLPPRPSRSNTRRAPRASPGPSRPSPSSGSSGLISGTAPWLHAGGWRLVDGGGAWWTGGRAEGECGWAWCQEGRKYSPLHHVHPSAQTASLPTPLPPPPTTVGAPPRRRRNALGPCSASALAASLARLGGLPYLNLGDEGRCKASRYYFDYCHIRDNCAFVIIYIIAFIVLIGVVFEGTC